MTAVNTAGASGANGAMAIADPGSRPPTLNDLMKTYQLKCLKGIDALAKTQMDAMKASNLTAEKLNNANKVLTTCVDKFGAENDPNKKRTHTEEEKQALELALNNAGIYPPTLFGGDYVINGGYNANRTIRTVFGDFQLPPRPVGADNISLADFRAAAATIKGRIEANSGNQSLLSVDLQATMSQRNQLFDIVSGTVQKTADADRDVIRKAA